MDHPAPFVIPAHAGIMVATHLKAGTPLPPGTASMDPGVRRDDD
jgi:hypothetical protein